MKNLYAVILLLFCYAAKADEAPHKMQDLLLRTNLIAKVKITSHSDEIVRVQVLDILHNFRTGIKQGDYLKIQYHFNVICPVPFPRKYAEENREALAFLSFKDNRWYLTCGEIAFLNDGKATVRFFEEGFEYSESIEGWKRDLQGYFSHFSLNKEDKLTPRLSAENWQDNKLTALSYLQYAGFYHPLELNVEDFPSLKPLFIEVVTPADEIAVEGAMEDEVYTLVDTDPISDSVSLEIMKALLKRVMERHPELKDSGIQGNTYYSLRFEKDGRISEVKILRSVAEQIDEEIEQYFKEHPQWLEPLNENGKPVRYKKNMVFRYRIDLKGGKQIN